MDEFTQKVRQLASQVGIFYEGINSTKIARLTALAARSRATGREGGLVIDAGGLEEIRL